ncbi:MAG: hypothetical protein Q7R67_02495 [bacterium]|nr:hypothetical protein [bacterium]
MAEENKSKVDELSDTLYSRTRYQDPLDKRAPVREVESPDVKEVWESPALDEILTRERLIPATSPFIKKFFVFALLFFIATILVAGIIFMGGTNFISSKNVDVSVLGPTTASAGEVLELGVTIANKNNTDLELANFSIQYPSGSRDPADSAKSLTFSKEELGVIGAGDEATRNVRFVLIGSTGEIKEVKFSVEYKIKGSNATFYKDKIYQITIGNAPLTITVESPPSVTSGDTFTTTVELALNSTDILKNVMLRAEYPYGYSVVSAVPEFLTNNNVWALGDFPPGSKKTVTIRGRLVGENQEERTMRFYVGVSESGSLSPDFKSIIASAQHTVAISRPSIGLSVNFNGESAPVYTTSPARPVSTAIKFQNNLPEKLLNPKLEVRFSGTALDKATVFAQNNGFYDSGANRVTWVIGISAGLTELNPGEGGTANVNFSSLPTTTGASTNREIDLQIVFIGTPVGSAKTVSVTESRTVRISSQVSLSSKAFYSIGPFTNTGPIPPKVEATTTYAVIWNVGNVQSALSDAKVTARLGTGVSWVAAHSSLSEDIAYDPGSNTVTWNMGNISQSGREVAFQIRLLPSVSQIGTAPVLVSSIVFTGIEADTGTSVTVASPALTTRLTGDPAFIQGDDVVIKK